MNVGQLTFLAFAGLAAGTVNGVAGGGSLISFPALLAVGLPPIVANVTSTVAIWPGYLGGVAGFRREVGGQRERIRSLASTTLIGAVAGAILLLTTPSTDFSRLAPYLILLACTMFAVQPILRRKIGHRSATETHLYLMHVGTFLGAVYGAYFGAGLGVFLLGVLGVALPDDLQHINALRSVLALIINTIAALIFATAGRTVWSAVAVMAAGSLIGGFFGATFARRLPAGAFRIIVIALGVAAAIRLFLE
jgi:hypothetical protein